MTKPRRVQWVSNEDLQCAILASMGLSTKCIMEETGLTACQVTYRLRMANIKRADYRNGESELAQLAIERALTYPPQTIRNSLNLKVVK